MKDANQNDKIDSALATGGKEPADALALAVNSLYHSHRQGVILCDYPSIAIYDNNGGAQNREAFWSALKQACSVAPYNIEGEGSYGRADDGTPNTRTLLVRCKYATERRDGFVTRDARNRNRASDPRARRAPQGGPRNPGWARRRSAHPPGPPSGPA